MKTFIFTLILAGAMSAQAATSRTLASGHGMNVQEALKMAEAHPQSRAVGLQGVLFSNPQDYQAAIDACEDASQTVNMLSNSHIAFESTCTPSSDPNCTYSICQLLSVTAEILN